MTVNFYTFSKRENSTKRPTSNPQTFDCKLKDDCGVVAPVIELNLGPTTNPSGLGGLNYCYIPDFDRYYFVSEWTWSRGLWVATLVEDVLASWRTLIGQSEEYVVRSAYAFNGDIVDNLYQRTGKQTVEQSVVGNPWEIPFDDTDLTNGAYVVGVIGDANRTNYYAMNGAYLTQFLNYLFSTGTQSYVSDLSQGLSGILPSLLQSANPLQYISSLRWYPINIDDALEGGAILTPVNFPVGFVKETSNPGFGYKVTKNGVSIKSYTINTRKHPDSASRGNYLNGPTFSAYILNCPPFGSYELDAYKISQVDDFEVTIRIDVKTGNGFLTVVVGNEMVLNVSSKVSVDIELSSVIEKGFGLLDLVPLATSLNPVTLAVQSSNQAGGLESVGSVPFMAGMQVAQAALGTVGEWAQSQIPTVSSRGADGGMASFYGPFVLYSIFAEVVDDDREQLGRPLCEKRQLSTLPGYLLVADPDIAIPGTLEENHAIKSYMAAGFFYE